MHTSFQQHAFKMLGTHLTSMSLNTSQKFIVSTQQTHVHQLWQCPSCCYSTLNQASVMVSKHVHSLRYICGEYVELGEDQGTLYFQMKLYDSKTYNHRVHRLSYHSAIIAINALVWAPESAPSLFFKPRVPLYCSDNDFNCSRSTQPHSLGDVIFIISKRFPATPC